MDITKNHIIRVWESQVSHAKGVKNLYHDHDYVGYEDDRHRNRSQQPTVHESFLCARDCPKRLSHVSLFTLHADPPKEMPFLSPFYSYGNEDPERDKTKESI